MNTFWLWTAFALLAVAIYAAFVWRRSRDRDRFRARLTVLFLAFALIPSALTIFILSNILSRSVETLFLPNVEPTLNEALETLRTQIEQEDARWVRAFRKRGPEVARSDSLLLWLATNRGGWKVVYGDSVTAVRFLRKHSLPAAKAASLHQSVAVRGALARVYSFEDTTGQVWLVCRRYPAALARVFEDLQETLRVYGTLALLREGVVRQQLIWGFGAALVLFLAVAAVLAARAVSRSVAEPVAQLSSAMSRVSQGDLDIQVAVRGNDEIASLARTFNSMIEELRLSRERLAQAERVAAWREVARQVSHEMRNALSPTQLTLHRLRRRVGDNTPEAEQIRELISSAERQLSMLTRMAEAFSQLARMPEPTFKPVDVNAVVRDVVALFEAQSHRVRFDLELDDSSPVIYADPDRLRQILNNLLRNAVEASGEQGVILVRTTADRENSVLQILVRDHGAGMTPETLRRVFKPYFSTKPSGTGLGLFIVKRIVEEHGGEIQLDSELGKGTTVVISFPLGRRKR